MKNDNWGREPFDLRLTILRMIRNLPGILAVTLMGTLLLGGGYYLKNVTFRERTYVATATFFLEYVDDNWYVNEKFINEYTWNVWVQADEFQDCVQARLSEAVGAGDWKNAFSASVPSDLRMVTVASASPDRETANALSEAVQSVMTKDFIGGVKDISSIRVVDVEEAAENLKTVKPGRALVLAVVVSAFAGCVFFLLRELIFESIWLPATLTNRYGLPNAGISGTEVFAENVKHFFKGKRTVAICPAEGDMDPAEVAGELGKLKLGENVAFLPLPCPTLAPESVSKLREHDGILLAVKAGMDVKRLELLLDFLEGQDCLVTAAMLWEEDGWLLRNYYRWNFNASKERK